MQAMGFYPSNQEIDDLINQVKYSRFAQGKGEEVDWISFPDLIRLFLNHRPFEQMNSEALEVALSHAKALEPGKAFPTAPVKKLTAGQKIKADGIVAILQQYGIIS